MLKRVRYFRHALFLIGLLLATHTTYMILHPSSFMSIQLSKAYVALPAGIVLMIVGVVLLKAMRANPWKLYASQRGLELVGPRVRQTAEWSDIDHFEADLLGLTAEIKFLDGSKRDVARHLTRIVPLGGSASEFAAFLNELKAEASTAAPARFA